MKWKIFLHFFYVIIILKWKHFLSELNRVYFMFLFSVKAMGPVKSKANKSDLDTKKIVSFPKSIYFFCIACYFYQDVVTPVWRQSLLRLPSDTTCNSIHHFEDSFILSLYHFGSVGVAISQVRSSITSRVNIEKTYLYCHVFVVP